MNRTKKQIFDEALSEVSNKFSVSKEDILGSCRKREFVDCRKALVYILYDLSLFKFSHPMLVELMNKSNHTTTLNLLIKARDMIMSGDKHFFHCVYDVVYSINDDVMMARLINAVKDSEDSTKNVFKIQKFR